MHLIVNLQSEIGLIGLGFSFYSFANFDSIIEHKFVQRNFNSKENVNLKFFNFKWNLCCATIFIYHFCEFLHNFCWQAFIVLFQRAKLNLTLPFQLGLLLICAINKSHDSPSSTKTVWNCEKFNFLLNNRFCINQTSSRSETTKNYHITIQICFSSENS